MRMILLYYHELGLKHCVAMDAFAISKTYISADISVSRNS
jgi:hypothetical protein